MAERTIRDLGESLATCGKNMDFEMASCGDTG